MGRVVVQELAAGGLDGAAGTGLQVPGAWRTRRVKETPNGG